MNTIKATWQNGQLVPLEPVNLPEGSELLVDVVDVLPSEKIGLDESEWRDDPEALADWDAWIKTIEPFELTDEERKSMQTYEEKFRRFNLEAVRRQMGLSEQP